MEDPIASRHASVLLNEVTQAFEGTSLKIFVDCTLGAGGHAQAVLKQHPELVQFVGIDQDPVAQNLAKQRLASWLDKVTFVSGNFKDLAKHLNSLSIEKVDGILLDLGVSSMQLDMPEKGFSFSKEGPLDMRMDPEAPLTAADVVNTYSEGDLGRIFRDLGEEKQWRLAAFTIVQRRLKHLFTTTRDLAETLYPVLVRKAKKGIHPLTLIFQALRIHVNHELEVLQKVLPDALELLRPGGRLAVISFHSLEDRIVKNLFRYEADDKESTSGIAGVFKDKLPRLRLVHRKALVPTEEEMARNPRSRSAKLRIVERL